MRSPFYSLIALAIVSAAVAGCSLQPLAVLSLNSGGPPVASAALQQTTTLASANSTAAAQARFPLSGLVTAPSSLVTSAGIVANSGAGVMANGGAGVIANGGAGVIANGGAALQPTALAGARHLLAADDVPLAGAKVTLCDAAGVPVEGLPSVVTGADGRYTVTGVPADLTVVVRVEVATRNGKPVTFETLASADAAGTSADVTPASTLVAASILAGVVDKLESLERAALTNAIATLSARLASGGMPDFSNRSAVLDKAKALRAADAGLQVALDGLDQAQEDAREAAQAATSAATGSTSDGNSGQAAQQANTPDDPSQAGGQSNSSTQNPENQGQPDPAGQPDETGNGANGNSSNGNSTSGDAANGNGAAGDTGKPGKGK